MSKRERTIAWLAVIFSSASIWLALILYMKDTV